MEEQRRNQSYQLLPDSEEEEVVPAKVSILGGCRVLDGGGGGADQDKDQGSLAGMAAGGNRAVKNRTFKNQDASTTDL